MTKTQKITTALAVLVLSTGMTWNGYADNEWYFPNKESSQTFDNKTVTNSGGVAIDNGAVVTFKNSNINVPNDRLEDRHRVGRGACAQGGR